MSTLIWFVVSCRAELGSDPLSLDSLSLRCCPDGANLLGPFVAAEGVVFSLGVGKHHGVTAPIS